MEKGDIAIHVLDKLRDWLISGATIKATCVANPILKLTNDACIGGLTVTFPVRPDYIITDITKSYEENANG